MPWTNHISLHPTPSYTNGSARSVNLNLISKLVASWQGKWLGSSSAWELYPCLRSTSLDAMYVVWGFCVLGAAQQHLLTRDRLMRFELRPLLMWKLRSTERPTSLALLHAADILDLPAFTIESQCKAGLASIHHIEHILKS